ncbi:LysR family transcriptional regulator [Gilliamella sp. B2894]|uniref:LysR family transcriptional regulator n=1 Tax=unclassified Gilliamella TaxID=2685620 RepID=UPI00226A8C48|nr:MULTISPECIES: LysR family transcriptional regulator [unclassified Gilliamella]MCX8656060.1 LysR family transcriptional regulator [Gilliamella sp. B2894]MCX8693435.1 LysR family transcriptional regulator [Gilliamella sp. B2881]MCX8695703.1 LysR family transcriptional regulator [Gilliamella sp. B2828]
MTKINSLNMMQYIDVLLKHGNYTKAAKNLYISQSYLTQTIIKVENQIGIEIINRQTVPLQLTEAGKIYYQYLASLVDKEEQFKRKIKKYTDTNYEVIQIGVLPCLGTYLLPLFLPEFMQKYPNVKIELHEYTPTNLEEKTENNTLDFFIGQNPETISQNLISHTCGKHCYYALIPQSSKLYQKNPKILECNNDVIKMLLQEKLILTAHGSAIRHQIEYLIQKYKIEPQIILESSNIFTLVELAKKGIGITFIPESVNICNKKNDQAYNLLPLPLDLISLNYFIAYSANRALNSSKRALVDIFISSLNHEAKPFN